MEFFRLPMDLKVLSTHSGITLEVVILTCTVAVILLGRCCAGESEDKQQAKGANIHCFSLLRLFLSPLTTLIQQSHFTWYEPSTNSLILILIRHRNQAPRWSLNFYGHQKTGSSVLDSEPSSPIKRLLCILGSRKRWPVLTINRMLN